MSAIDYAAQQILYSIPEELLNVAFNIDLPPQQVGLTSLKEKIAYRVIRPRVMMDCNLVGGQELIVPLSSATVKVAHKHLYTIYEIPSELLQNRRIVSVLSLSHMLHTQALGQYPGNMGGQNISNVNHVQSVGNRIGNAAGDVSPFINTTVEVIGHNRIIAYANFRILANATARILVENNEDFANLSSRSYPQFSMLCVLAVKAFIYNKLVIAIDSGQLAFGRDLGVFRTTVEEYRDANDEYMTYLREIFQSVMLMNDSVRSSRFIKSMINPGI